MQSLVFCLIMLVHRVIAVVHHPLGQHQQQQQSWPAIIASSSFNGGEDVDRSHQAALPSSVNRLERSLFSGESSCSEPSEISENTIIRTKDSRALGARFLNETSLGSDARDRCMALCCSFHGCNVAVYEEKVMRLNPSICSRMIAQHLLPCTYRMGATVICSTAVQLRISAASSPLIATTPAE